jgi:hypothetical protein
MSQEEREKSYDDSPNAQRIIATDGCIDFVKQIKWCALFGLEPMIMMLPTLLPPSTK